MGALVFVLALGALSPLAAFILWIAYKIGGGKRGFLAFAKRL